MREYKSIKQLVIDETISSGGLPSFETLTNLVQVHFPNSKWQQSHYDWYKSQIKTGKIEITALSENDDEIEVEKIEEQEVTEFAVSIEKDLQNYLSKRLNEIEDGLTLIGTEYGTAAGFIDILCKDSNGDYVVIETKAGKAKDAALGQILGYIGALIETGVPQKIRGILVASDFDNRLLFASKAIGNISLIKYNLSFKFTHITSR
jgi:RecB family endonuclease NucS